MEYQELAMIYIGYHNGEQVLPILGSPSSIPTLNSELVWLYLSEVTDRDSILKAKAIKKESIRVVFDLSWRVLRVDILSKSKQEFLSV